MTEDDEVKVISTRKVEAMTGLSRSSLYRMRREGDFPKPVQLTRQRIGWRTQDVRDWINQRVAGGAITA